MEVDCGRMDRRGDDRLLLPLRPVPAEELKREDLKHANHYSFPSEALLLRVGDLSHLSAFSQETFSKENLKMFPLPEHPQLTCLHSDVSGFRPFEANTSHLEPDKEACSRTTPSNHTAIARWQHGSLHNIDPRFQSFSPISVDTNSYFNNYLSGPLSAPGALLGSMHSSPNRGEDRPNSVISQNPLVPAPFYSPYYDQGYGAQPQRQDPFAAFAPTPMFPHVPYSYQWPHAPSMFMWQELYHRSFLWNGPYWPGSTTGVPECSDLGGGLPAVPMFSTKGTFIDRDSGTAILQEIPTDQETSSQDVVKQEEVLSPIQEECISSSEENKPFAGLQVLAQGVEKMEKVASENSSFQNTLQILCNAAKSVEDEECSPCKRPHIYPKVETGISRSRSLDSKISNGTAKISRRYKSLEAEKEAKAFLASKANKANDNSFMEMSAKETSWELQMRKNLANIQQQYKSKYKELYKLQHSFSKAKAVTKKLKEKKKAIKECWEANNIMKMDIAVAKDVVRAQDQSVIAQEESAEGSHKPVEESVRVRIKKPKSVEQWTLAKPHKIISVSQTTPAIVDLPVLKHRKHKHNSESLERDVLDDCEQVSAKENGVFSKGNPLQLNDFELREGTRVLTRRDNFFYAGKITEICPPDIYGVVIDHERRNKPHIHSREEIFLETVREVVPADTESLPVGTRVCAFWSKTYKHLYSGYIGDPILIDPKLDRKRFVNIELDDGDSRDIPIEDIRLLPKEFPFKERPSGVSGLIEIDRKLCSATSNENMKTAARSAEAGKASVTHRKKTKRIENSTTAPLIPVSQLWTWSNEEKSKKGRRQQFQKITRGEESLRLGDCAVFLSTEDISRPFVGRLESMWETKRGERRVRVRWFYHASETSNSSAHVLPLGALFESQHYDENDIQTISHKCEVLTYSEFHRRADNSSQHSTPRPSTSFDKNQLYFLSGNYDPIKGTIIYEKDVLQRFNPQQ